MTVSDSVGSAAGIPIQMHAALLRNLHEPLVFEGLTTREYEGDISQAGDAVSIITTSQGTISNYVRGTPVSAQSLVLSRQQLVISQQKSFALEANDLDVKQVKPDFWDEQMSEAGYLLRETRDAYIAGVMKAGVAAGNDLGTFSIGTGAGDADMFELLARLATVLDDTKTPAAGNSPSMDADSGPGGGFRFVVLPPFACEMLVIDPRKSSFGTTDNLKTYGERYIGRSVAGLEIFKSLNCPVGDTGATYRDVIAGWSKATAFASQLVEFKTQDKQLDFAKYYLGLDVYGAKVIRAEQLATAEIVRA